jgi:hypothetical protein
MLGSDIDRQLGNLSTVPSKCLCTPLGDTDPRSSIVRRTDLAITIRLRKGLLEPLGRTCRSSLAQTTLMLSYHDRETATRLCSRSSAESCTSLQFSTRAALLSECFSPKTSPRRIHHLTQILYQRCRSIRPTLSTCDSNATGSCALCPLATAEQPPCGLVFPRQHLPTTDWTPRLFCS